MVRPVNQVVGGHQNQSAVVAPSIRFRTLPLRGADTFLLAEDVKVRHSNIELAVRRTIDMRIAYAVLLGYRVARNNRLGVVHCRKRIAVIADGHKQSVGGIAEIGEEVGTHILFGEGTLGFCRRRKCDESDKNQ